MGELSSTEHAAVERAQDEPMLDQVLAWSAVNSGSRNLPGPAAMGGLLGNAFAELPGEVELVDPSRVEAVDPAGKTIELPHGKNLRLRVRPDAPVQLLFTGHMDTVFPVDHPFQETRWLDDAVINGPGTADMKGGVAVMLAALKAIEATDTAR